MRPTRGLAALVLLVQFACAGPDLAELGERYGFAPAGGGGGVVVTYLGCTTLLFDDGQTALMTDGFFTRPGMWSVALDRRVAPDPAIVRAALARARVERLAMVTPVHSHFDHALDTPEVARQTGAVVLGSETTANIARGQGLPESQIEVVEPGRAYAYGRFQVTLLESAHAPIADGGAPFPGTIDEPLVHPAPVSAFLEGRSYSILVEHPTGTALVQGSAGFVPGALGGRRADVVYLGVGGLGRLDEERPGYRRQYWDEIVKATGASLIRPIHHDDFTQPFGSTASFPSAIEDLDEGLRALADIARDEGVRMEMMRLLEPVAMAGPRRSP